MKIGIIGPGAMGLLFGGYLSQNNQVTLIGRNSEKVKKVNEKGVHIKENNGEEKIFYPKAYCDTSSLPVQDIVIVFVKSGDSQEALEKCKNIIGDNTLLMTLQNGMGHEELLCNYAKKSNILIGTTNQGSYLTDCNSLCHSGGGNTSFGVLEGNVKNFTHIADMFEKSGFPCNVTEDIKFMIWNKIMINASSSVLSGLMQTAQGYVVQSPTLWEICKKLIGEICEVANADGCKFDAQEQIQRIYDHLNNAPGGFTGIYADIKAGRKTEVRRINGAVSDIGKKYNIPTPTHDIITGLVIATEQRENFM